MAGLSNISSSESKPTRNAYVVYEDLAINRCRNQENKKISWITMLRTFVMKQQIPAIILDKEKNNFIVLILSDGAVFNLDCIQKRQELLYTPKLE
jgi:hypothetical protein